MDGPEKKEGLGIVGKEDVGLIIERSVAEYEVMCAYWKRAVVGRVAMYKFGVEGLDWERPENVTGCEGNGWFLV